MSRKLSLFAASPAFTETGIYLSCHSFLSQAAAKSANLAYINSAGQAIMAVDSTSVLKQGAFRKSVRITSQAALNIGSLVILDAAHSESKETQSLRWIAPVFRNLTLSLFFTSSLRLHFVARFLDDWTELAYERGD